MKAKSTTRKRRHGQALATFKQLPEKKQRLLRLKREAERATGEEALRIQKKIRRLSK